MISATRICTKCGAEIPADAPEGGCPGCLLESGLRLLDEEAVAGVDSSTVAAYSAEAAAKAGSAKADDPGQLDKPARAANRSERFAAVLGELGDYELLEEVGRGGQGVVFRARQKSLNRTVALKVISLGQWASQAHLKRFRREAEAAASLDHAGIVPIYEVGERDGTCYFSMKFVEGGQLDEVVRRTPMSIRHAAELIAKVARTVHYAHEHGILHRDIKPGNILFDKNGEPHLTDFGLARLLDTQSSVTRTIDVLGTPSYMAPEQAAGETTKLSKATDVYGLGAVLYQLLTGQPPFAGGTTYETIRLLRDTEPRQPRVLNPKIDRDLSTICLKCLEKHPERRYSSPLALAEDLERWLKHEPIRARRTGIFSRGKKWVRRNPTSALLAASLIVLAAASGWIIWKSELIRQPVTTGIAVLPFENLNDQKENSVFADGVQDDILTKLAKIAGLKVISRTSVMDYRGKRNVRQIGNALRVSHVLEGSARRSGDRVHVNAQLIDTRTDTHVWAEQYNRDLNDLFAIQSEIAQKIAEHLHAKLSASEKASVEEKPTQDLVAYDFYVRAKLLVMAHYIEEKNFLEAERLLDQAIARDPDFFLAYCLIAEVQSRLYWNFYHTPVRRDLAERAVKAALHLRPEAGEGHLARAQYLARCDLDYDRAREELALAQRALPNNVQVFVLLGHIDRMQSRWNESVRNFEEALEFDPRNLLSLRQLALGYQFMHRFAESVATLDRAVALTPQDANLRVLQAWVGLQWRADPKPLHDLLQALFNENPAVAAGANPEFWLDLALCERDSAAAGRALAAIGEGYHRSGLFFSRTFMKGCVARTFGDDTAARKAFTAARIEVERTAREQPDYGPPLGMLGLIDAGLGRKEEAIREGRRASELLPVAKDAVNGANIMHILGIIYAWTGEKDLAITQIAATLRVPNVLSYGELKLHPFWDPLRGDPRFEKLVEEAKKPVALK
jgi:serine/threonine protein kinase/tetratricopeptide (TPR) repeat protein